MSFHSRSKKPYSRPAVSRADAARFWAHDRAVAAPQKPTQQHLAPASLNSKLVVSNLHYEITPKDLSAIFGQIGTLVREPLIKYDLSGRSTGIAIISFETPAEATRAKKQFDGILAKGQPMAIAYDTMPIQKRRSASLPSSLLNRISKPPLLQRFGRENVSAKAAIVGVGPVRSRPPPRGPKKPKTAEELDKELDAFMGDAEAVRGEGNKDVEMA